MAVCVLIVARVIYIRLWGRLYKHLHFTLYTSFNSGTCYLSVIRYSITLHTYYTLYSLHFTLRKYLHLMFNL